MVAPSLEEYTTFATSGFELSHLSALMHAAVGVTVGVIVSIANSTVSPTQTLADPSYRVTPVAGVNVGPFTVTISSGTKSDPMIVPSSTLSSGT